VETSIREYVNTKNSKIIFLEGALGSGKSTVISKAKSLLEKNDFDLCIAECQENEAYHHPLYPYAAMLPIILAAVDKATAREFNMTSNIQNSKKLMFSSNSGVNASLFLSDRGNGLASMQRPSGQRINPFADFKNRFSRARVTPLVNSESERKNYSEAIKNLKGSALLIKSTLERAGEDLNVSIPLLNVLISYNVEDTSFTEKIGPDGRTLLLSNLFVRLLDIITANINFAIIIDDLQWYDFD
jgi:predicted ATPase